MFFFFFSQYSLSPDEENFLHDNNELVIDRLLLVTESKGIRNSDIVSLTGWSPSKVSKLVKKNQRLSIDDLKNWAKCLGYTPDVFLQPDMDTREYRLSESVRDVRSLFDEVAKYKGDISEVAKLNDVVTYEFPLSMLAALELEPSDYISSGIIDYPGFDVYAGEDSEYSDKGIHVKIRQRNVTTDSRIFVEYTFSPDRRYAVLGLYMCPAMALRNSVRMKEKDTLLVEEEDTRKFDNFSRKEIDWFPATLRTGEIASFIYDMSKLPDNEELESNLEEIYDRYCDLIYAKTHGADIKRRSTNASKIDYYRALDGESLFESSTEKKVLKSRQYKCEIDAEHQSFLDDNNHPYMYLDPLIPFKSIADYGEEIKGEANCVCLCPMCHAKYSHGKKKDREQMVFDLYRKHETILRNKGIDVTLSEVLKLNRL